MYYDTDGYELDGSSYRKVGLWAFSGVDGSRGKAASERIRNFNYDPSSAELDLLCFETFIFERV